MLGPIFSADLITFVKQINNRELMDFETPILKYFTLLLLLGTCLFSFLLVHAFRSPRPSNNIDFLEYSITIIHALLFFAFSYSCLSLPLSLPPKCLLIKLRRLPAATIKTTSNILPPLSVPFKPNQILPTHPTIHLSGAHRSLHSTTRP